MREKKLFSNRVAAVVICAARTKRRAHFQLIRRHAQRRLANAGRHRRRLFGCGKSKPRRWRQRFLSIPIFYRGAALSSESDSNQTLDLLARIDIEDLANASDRIRGLGDRLGEEVIEVLRAHLIQRGSLPDPAVFEEAAATVAYRLPGFSPPRERAVTMTIYGVTTTVTSPQEYERGYVVIPSLFIDRGNQNRAKPDLQYSVFVLLCGLKCFFRYFRCLCFEQRHDNHNHRLSDCSAPDG